MKENNTSIYTDSCVVAVANDSPVSKEIISGFPENPPVDHVDEGISPTSIEVLRPTCPNPDKGFQPLSLYLINLIVEYVMRHMKELCKKRHIALDIDYWKRLTRFILSPQSIRDTLLISSPAGSGKSTWIESFTQAITELFEVYKQLVYSLVGVVVVLQKVEDLNRLAEVLNAGTPEDRPNMVPLQGWSLSGQRHDFCRNSTVNCFDECHPGSCSQAQWCEVLAFRRQAPVAPIIGLTQERFAMLRESGSLDSVLYRLMEDGRLLPRRYLIFDEKFPMVQINTLDKSCIDLASMEFSGLIEKIAAPDSRVRSLQQSLSYHVEQPFQALRRSLCVQTEFGNRDIQAGFCVMPSEYTSQDRCFAFQTFSDFVLWQKSNTLPGISARRSPLCPHCIRGDSACSARLTALPSLT